MNCRTTLVIAGITACLLAGGRNLQSQNARSQAAQPLSSEALFDSSVAPIIARHCLECHDTSSRKGRLDLSKREAATAWDRGGQLIVPGKPEESALWKSVESDEMPENRPSLSPEEKLALRQWIEAGAAWTADEIEPLSFTRDTRASQNWIRRLTVPEYIETVRSAAGVDIEEEARRILPPDVRADGFHNTAYNLGSDLHHVEAFSSLAAVIVSRMDVPRFAARFAGCSALEEDCLRELISGMGKWLLRGPLNDHEIKSFLSIARAVKEDGGNFTEAVSYVLEGMLQSPRFIYLLEDQHGDGTLREVKPHELASRLSYILWGGPPDEELMQAADSNQLSDERSLRRQVARMLEDPRAIKRSSRFIYEWLDLDRMNNLRPDPERFPAWHDQLAADMREETLAFFEEIAWRQKRPLADLMNAGVTMATPRLAEFYGLSSKDPGASRHHGRVQKDLQILYTFDEGGGDLVRDLSGAGTPVHLKIDDPPSVRWSHSGLTLLEPTQLTSLHPPRRLVEAVRESKAVTIEAWITTSSKDQSGPARIVSMSSGVGARNFTLGQDGGKVDVRFRTRSTSGNGQPATSAEGLAEHRLTHVTYTRDASGNTRIYINGEQKASGETKGELNNWDQNFQLLLGNESTSDRPWLGTFHLVAIYSRALSQEEVQKNHAAGARRARTPVLAGAKADGSLPGLQALYDFAGGSGSTVPDKAGAGTPLDLKIEKDSAVEWAPEGLRLKDSTVLAHAGAPRRLIEAIQRTEELSIEAWITPANLDQSGPARILTLSSGSSERNFTLGQEKGEYQVRLRAAGTNPNGLPALATGTGAASTRLTHLVYTRDRAGTATFYLDGAPVESTGLPGDFSNWSTDYKLAVGNETSGDRPWKGTLHLLAIYNRALSEAEVRNTGQSIRKYDLAENQPRGGLLTQGSLLTVGGEEASTVARGLFILHDFLYSAVGNPPPCLDTSPVPAKPGLSKREIAQARVDNNSCGGCHSKFEPLAFGLEKFDGLGQFVEVDEHGNKLRDDGEILFPGQAKPVPFASASELMDILAASPRVHKNITRKVTQFALGRPLVESDAKLVDRIHDAAAEGGGTYASLITAIVTSDLVRKTPTETTR